MFSNSSNYLISLEEIQYAIFLLAYELILIPTII